MIQSIFKAFLVLLLETHLCLSLNSPIGKRFIMFNDLNSRDQIALTSGYVISQIQVRNRLQCAVKCLQIPECKSYTFCQRFCNLHSIGLNELHRNENHAWYTSSYPNCYLISMNRNFVPQCEEFGINRSIRKDSDPNFCNISQKRVDGSFLAREYFNASIDSPEEFKGFTTRKCLPETAMNGGYCKTGNETQPVWVKWVDSIQTFNNSVQICENIGGILYPDLEGDVAQIEFLKRYSNARFWMGVTRHTEWYLWKNLRGEDMKPDRMRWAQFDSQNQGEVVRTSTRKPSVTNISSQSCKPVCQMIV